MDSSSRPAAAPFHIMTKPIGPLCNLDCQYCFYLEKEKLFPGNERFRMSTEMLETYTRAYIEAQPAPEVTFAWQGGEPTLMGVGFFRQAVEFQKQYANGKTIHNAFQTNGTLLDDEWGAFLAENKFLIGLSVDGPAELHDTYRVNKKGQPSFAQVMRGLEILQKHKVEYNTLTCVHRANSAKPLEVYRFLRGIGSTYLQFIPIVERKPNASAKAFGLELGAPPATDEYKDKMEDPEENSPVMPWSIKPFDYGSFLCAIFDRWVRHDVGRIFVQDFDVAFNIWLGYGSTICIHSETCGRALALEHDGSLYCCDHYVYPTHKLGNIATTPIATLADSAMARQFGNHKRDSLPAYCRRCEVRFACQGGCPKHRFMRSPMPENEPGLNYLCPGYRMFYNHIRPAMDIMVQLFRSQQAPANVMQLIDRQG